jgi:hypothetical protein
MREQFRFSGAVFACLLAWLCAEPCAGRTAIPKSFADDKTRAIEGGRKVLVVLASPEIEAGFDHMEVSPAALLFGFVGYRWGLDPMNRELAEEATPRVLPLRHALAGYDFNTRLYDAVVPVVQASTWLRGQDFERTADASLGNLEKGLNDSNTRQMFVLGGQWSVDHHHQAIVVELTATILVRKIPKGQYSNARLKRDYIPYQQVFRSITYLPGNAGTPAAGLIARWAADDGALARRALDLGIERVRTLLNENLDASKAEAEVWRRRGERHTIERFDMTGWTVSREGDAERFVEARSGTLNYVQTLPSP